MHALDKSSSGAKIEIIRSRLSDTIDDVSVGDKLTLSFSSAQERSSVECEVMWTENGSCGVRYLGQFRTQYLKQPKASVQTDSDGAKPGSGKGAARGFGRASNTRKMG